MNPCGQWFQEPGRAFPESYENPALKVTLKNVTQVLTANYPPCNPSLSRLSFSSVSFDIHVLDLASAAEYEAAAQEQNGSLGFLPPAFAHGQSGSY
jgi:hypothetical protein